MKIKWNVSFNKSNIIRNFFSFSILLSFFIFIISNIITRGKTLNYILFYDSTDTFMDFYNSVYDVSARDPISRGCLYPPLCYMIFYMFNRFIPINIIESTWYYFPGGHSINWFQGINIAFFLFFSISLIIMYDILNRTTKGSNLSKKFFAFAVILSAPFLFQIERGNIIIISIIFAYIFCFYYNSENKIIKELALIALAISAGIKLYPAILGLILIKEKMFKEAIRCIIYGLCFFCLPFVFFGGFGQIGAYFYNLYGASSFMKSAMGYSYKINFSSTIEVILSLFNNTSDILYISNYIVIALIVLTVICIIINKEKWKIQALIILIIIGLPPFSYIYALIFMIIPLAKLYNKDKYSKFDFIYWILFIFLYIYIPFQSPNILSKFNNNNIPYTLSTFIFGITIIIFNITLICDTFFTLFKNKVLSNRHA